MWNCSPRTAQNTNEVVLLHRCLKIFSNISTKTYQNINTRKQCYGTEVRAAPVGQTSTHGPWPQAEGLWRTSLAGEGVSAS